MTPPLTISDLLVSGASHADSEIAVVGWVWDRFEHCAIYDSLPSLGHPEPSAGVWLAGQLPARRTARGDSPLHGQRVIVAGRFHWQPNSGAGHFSLWPAWIGVRRVESMSTSASPA